MVENTNLTTKQLWKIGDVALYLNKTPQAIYKMVARGQIPYVKMGNGASALRFIPSDVEACILQNRHKAYAVEGV